MKITAHHQARRMTTAKLKEIADLPKVLTDDIEQDIVHKELARRQKISMKLKARR